MKLSIFVLIFVAVAVGLIFQTFLYYKKEEIISVNISKTDAIKLFIFFVAAGVFIRALLFAAIKGYDTDISCFVAWGNQIINDGLSSFYTAAGHEWYDYPPGYMLVLAVIAYICKLLHLTYQSFLGKFIFLIPAITADMLSAYFAYRLSAKLYNRSFALLMAAFIIFNPAVFFLSGAWGQIDSILTLFLVLTFYYAYTEKYYLMGLCYGLAIATKWQALILGPVLVIVLVCFHNYKERKENLKILKLLLAAVISLAVIMGLSLPFKGDQSLFWIVNKFNSSTLGYNYATIEAYNFFAVCKANWRWADDAFLFGLSYKTFGTIMIVLIAIATIVACILDRKHFKSDYKAMMRRIFLHASFFMFGVYTFGHYMHERYIFPVIILMLISFILESKKDILFCNVLLSGTVFLNEMIALYVAKPSVIDTVRMSTSHVIISVVCGVCEVLCFAYFTYIYISRNKYPYTNASE